MACPFGQSSKQIPEVKPTATGWQARKQHVIYLYAEYVHLSWLQEVWSSPLTEKPLLEPCFAAAFHGIELCFLLLAEFVADKRKYVAKRPRIDMVATDIQEQCMLLTEIIDGELEDEMERQSQGPFTSKHIIDGELEDETERQSRATLTQAFPFEACPPTTRQTSHSPGLQRLADAVARCREGMTVAERNSLIKVVLNITNTFDSSFGRWTVGLGIEHQLNELRVAAGLPEEARFRSRAQNLDYAQLLRPELVQLEAAGRLALWLSLSCVELRFRSRAQNLDYAQLVRPEVGAAEVLSQAVGSAQRRNNTLVYTLRSLHLHHGSYLVVVESTLTAEDYVHSEDFFFRTVHLGVECWAFIAHNRVEAALGLAAAGHWHVAAARIMQTSRLLHYLGDHILLLTSMNLRDYLLLKVEIEGTSGEGSMAVKSFRDKIRGLFDPFLAAAPEAAACSRPSGVTVSISVQPAGSGSGCAAACEGSATSDAAAAQQSAILAVYQQPDRHAGLYNYAKALESVESALLGGFYYKHFLLAKNVIGTSAKGTMNRAVTALQHSFQAAVFPELDSARSLLGARMDAALADRKGRIMKNIEERGRSDSPASARGRNSPAG